MIGPSECSRCHYILEFCKCLNADDVERDRDAERSAWVLLVNATIMRGNVGAYPDPFDAMGQACRDRSTALETLSALGVDTTAVVDPHGLWPSEDACAAWAAKGKR